MKKDRSICLAMVFIFSIYKLNGSDDRFGFSDLLGESNIALAKLLIKELVAPSMPILPVTVKQSTDLCKQEQRFLHNRLPCVQAALQQYFAIDTPLRIGFCCSGGGNRAMIGTLGLLTGAAKTHVLDATMYLAGLSGSTWLLSQFCFLAATTYQDKTYEETLQAIFESYTKLLDDFSMLHIHGVYAPALLSFDSTDDICLEIATRFAYQQPLTLVNLFGALVGDYALGLMGHDRLSEKWSTIIPVMQKGKVPLPLCASIFEITPKQYGWFEMSPFECGNKNLGYIPVQYLGSPFSEGLLQEDMICPEYPISFYLGMYGSAFALAVQDIARAQQNAGNRVHLCKECTNNRFMISTSMLQNLAKTLIKELMGQRNPLTFAQFPNYAKDQKDGILCGHQTLGLFDAGIAFDLPLPMFIDRPERTLDIIFLYASFPGDTKTLQDLEKYCYQQSIAFPDLSALSDQDLVQKSMLILNSPDDFDYNVGMPTYFYFPTNGISIYELPYVTLNFRYTAQEVTTLAAQTQQAFESNFEIIQDIMQKVAHKKALVRS